MDTSLVFEIIKWLVIVLLAVFAAWLRAHEDVMGEAEAAIAKAEEAYKDASNAGGQKFEYAVDWLYAKLPVFLKPFISKTTIGAIVQTAFDATQVYLMAQMDKAASKLLPKDSDNTEE